MSRHCMRVALVVAAAMSAAPWVAAPEAKAQSAPEPALGPGSKLRVWLDRTELPITGTYVSQDQDTLVIRPPGASATRTVPLSQVSRLQYSAGRHGHAGSGMGIGLLFGALLGGGAGASACEDGLISQGDCTAAAAVFGGLVGTFSGLIVGAISRSDRWEPASIKSLSQGAAFSA